jgi:acyl carrier protein
LNQDPIIDAVAQIIRDVLDLPDLVVTAATTAKDVDGWDSFNHINIVVAIESHFGIKFKTAEFETMADVGALTQLLHEKLMRRRP